MRFNSVAKCILLGTTTLCFAAPTLAADEAKADDFAKKLRSSLPAP